ncbi:MULTISPECIES: TIGR02757 family protein [Amniculibacterium]|uniref:TIGR02757 family protein n=1 Tax=Amniculibacterium TaxID=2715289 RepID=UPI000F598E33|nr:MULTISPECIES: TIGR02757 family protein [Amniculibacterium]
MKLEELKIFLDEKENLYNRPDFIENDPIQIPHLFTEKQDIEIAGFLASIIAWGNRKSIINDAHKMLNFMGNSPYDFVMNFTKKDLKNLSDKAIHRTFSAEDFQSFLWNLKRIYQENNSLETLFLLNDNESNCYHSIERFRVSFLGDNLLHRSQKHIASPYKNSSAKRLMMFLRWMVRQDKKGVDFGIWKSISPSVLSIPLDVHTGNISRRLNLVHRKQNDWKTVEELDKTLRILDPKDPAKYDFALFGLGVTGEL